MSVLQLVDGPAVIEVVGDAVDIEAGGAAEDRGVGVPEGGGDGGGLPLPHPLPGPPLQGGLQVLDGVGGLHLHQGVVVVALR